jgi:hypothetical protein
MGPVEVIIVSFPRAGLVASIGPALVDLVSAGHLRILDAIVVSVHEDGTMAITDLDDTIVPSWSTISPSPRPMLSSSDAELAAAGLASESIAMLIAVEQTWPTTFAHAALDSGGVVELHARISPETALAAARVSA